MQRLLVVNGDLFTRLNVAAREEQHVTVDGFHVSVRLAAVVDVVSAVAATTAVKAPAAIDVTDSQLRSTRSSARLEIRNSLAGVFGDLSASLEMDDREAAFTVD